MIVIHASVIVFDLDDTLYCERDYARGGFAAVGCQLADRLNGAEFAKWCGALLDQGARGDIFDRALAAMGMPADARLVQDMVAAYRAHRPHIALCPDAEAFLGRIGNRMTGLISDGLEPVQRAKVASLGLESRLGRIVLTGAWPAGFGKPHPRAFESIADWSGHSPEQHVYIADNALKDFIAPRELGWKTVQIARPGGIHTHEAPSADHAADIRIASFDELGLAGPVPV